jgi:nicotinate phosphoribosyltransferase
MTRVTYGFLDNDFYQFTMGQVIWENHRHVKVRYRFRNRTFSVPLASRIGVDELRRVIDEVRGAYVATNDDISYLAATGLFSTEYLEALRDVRLPDIELGNDNGHLVATYEGDWWEAIFWETPLLYAINQAYYVRFGGNGIEGKARLEDKIDWLNENPQIRFADMGTRRRYNPYHQHGVIDRMSTECTNLVGTSNVHFAREFGLKPIGTMAHQLFMVTAALFIGSGETNINAAQQAVLTQWEDIYGDHPEMMTFLPDTYGTDYFLAGMSAERMERWTGIRQDSGDPIDVCTRMIRWMRANGVDPSTKRILPSDGLDLRRMAILHDKFSPHTNVSFGFGTGLTNDVGFEPLSIVVKPDAVLLPDRELPCVKLSDDPAKATGKPDVIAYYKKLVGLQDL